MLIRAFTLVAVSLMLEVVQAESRPGDSTSTQRPGTPRSISAIQSDIHVALREEASTRRSGDNTPQVLRLIELYREMAAHPQHEASFALRELGQQVRARLITIKGHVNRHSDPATGRARKKAEILPSLAGPELNVLAQQLPAPAQPANQPAAPPAGTAATPRPNDYGPELVALIEATISPDTWNINGGPSAIVYYAPLHAIIISAPDDVHSRVGGVLGQMRTANR